ncbi:MULTISPECIES: hypothetical protein [Halocynthiibacter]|uniref:YMGG-like Gly-zipper domain-containing protein n=1 Tax=Halocynthiibacter halioticoli TaxID=2986804 RepID=A0AAE3LPT5_9RHOB|nr:MULTISPECIES: hypothetical protein [Halocynthiibacter]MCV6823782.1 hypothetical protein [Halocynthiibacter halioticoli]MCW4056783.1 hypothetical protein [Halocynthiibacter sp. SDUM655004]MDE0590199.1 hypothetical protein [Halocynthiibacter sp. C4]
MLAKKLVVLFVATAFVAGCETNAQNAGVGALAGGALASATGGNVVTGAAVGAAGGALCKDANVCK